MFAGGVSVFFLLPKRADRLSSSLSLSFLKPNFCHAAVRDILTGNRILMATNLHLDKCLFLCVLVKKSGECSCGAAENGGVTLSLVSVGGVNVNGNGRVKVRVVVVVRETRGSDALL